MARVVISFALALHAPPGSFGWCEIFFGLIFIENLRQQIMNWLENFFASGVGQIEIVVHVVMADGAVHLDEPLVDLNRLHFVRAHRRIPLGDQLVRLGVFLTQRVRQMPARQKGLKEGELSTAKRRYEVKPQRDSYR